MAVPAFHAAGTAVFTANSVVTPTTLSPVAPTRSRGEYLLLVTESISITATCATPAGWNLVVGFPVTSATASGGRFYCFSRIALNTSADNPSVVWSGLTTGTSGDSCGARIFSYTNVRESRDDLGVTATDTAATTSWTMPACSTGINNSMVFGVSIKVSDTSQTTTITTFTERSDDNTQTGTGHITQVSEKLQATAGSTGTGTVTPSNTTSSRVLATTFSQRMGLMMFLDPVAVQSSATLDLFTPAVYISEATTFLTDTFTDTNATAITSHTPDTGGSWTSHPSYTAGAKIQSNQLEGESVSGLHYASAVPSSADYVVEGVIFRATNTPSSTEAGVALRLDTAANTYFKLGWVEFVGTATLALIRVSAGVSTTLWSFVDNPGDGISRTLRAELRGTIISVFVDGVFSFRGSVLSSGISAAGRVGARTNLGATSTGYHVDSITAFTRSPLTASGLSSATLALSAPTTIPLQAATCVSSATLALTAPTRIALDPVAAVSSATLALTAKATVTLQSASSVSSATLVLTAPAVLTLQASSAVSSATLTLTAPAIVVLGAASAVSSATLAVTVPTTAAVIPLDPVFAVAGQGSLKVLEAPTQIPLQASSAVSSATLFLTATGRVLLDPANAVSTATLALSAKTTITLAASTAVSSATLTLTAKATVTLQASSAVSSATLALTAPARITLGAATAVSSATLALTAQTTVVLQASSAQSSATAVVYIPGSSVIPLGPANAVSSATLALTAKTTITFAAASAVSSASLALTAATRITLAASSAVSSASLSLTTPARIPLSSADGTSSATLVLRALTGIPLAPVFVTSSASLVVTAPTAAGPALLLFDPANGVSSGHLILHAPTVIPPEPEPTLYDFTLNRVLTLYPVDTTLGVWSGRPEVYDNYGMSRLPAVAPVATATVAGDSVTITDLTAGDYFAIGTYQRKIRPRGDPDLETVLQTISFRVP